MKSDALYDFFSYSSTVGDVIISIVAIEVVFPSPSDDLNIVVSSVAVASVDVVARSLSVVTCVFVDDITAVVVTTVASSLLLPS